MWPIYVFSHAKTFKFQIQCILETFLPTFFDVDEAEHERFVASVGPCQFVKFGNEFFF